MLRICVLLLSLLSPLEGEQRTLGHSSVTGSHLTDTRRLDTHFMRLPRDIKGGQNITRVSQDTGGEGLSIDTLLDNQTQVVEDSHSYYKLRVYGPSDPRGQELWEDLPLQKHSKARVHSILSNTHRQASRVLLSFEFPFYGHPIRQITIATGGFIFMGDVLHRMLTATQYVAPLMANFNPSFSINSTISYRDNGSVFVVQWDNVPLHEKESAGGFTFQTALHRDGRIVFGYKEIPLPVQDISAEQHPVKAGISDAFLVLNPSPNVPESQKRTIYEYHRVQLDLARIQSQTLVEFNPLPIREPRGHITLKPCRVGPGQYLEGRPPRNTRSCMLWPTGEETQVDQHACLQQSSCEQCLTSVLTLNCSWCHVLQRCSSGFDRYRQDWLTYGCAQESQSQSCEDFADPYTADDTSFQTYSSQDNEWAVTTSTLSEGLTTEDDTKLTQYAGDELQEELPKQSGSPVHSGTIVGIVLAVLLISVIIMAVIYINRHPDKQGRHCCMKHRSHQWAPMKFHNPRNPAMYSEVEPTPGLEKDGIMETEP